MWVAAIHHFVNWSMINETEKHTRGLEVVTAVGDRMKSGELTMFNYFGRFLELDT